MSSADPVYDGSGVDPIEDARMHYQAIHGEKPPVTPEEANSRNHGVTTDHPYDSIMEEAELGVAEAFDAFREDSEEDFQYVNSEGRSEDDTVSDGGYDMAMPIGGMLSYSEPEQEERCVEEFSL